MYGKLSKLILAVSAASVMLKSGLDLSKDDFRLSATKAEAAKVYNYYEPYEEPPVPKNLPVYVPKGQGPREIKSIIETKHMAIHESWLDQKVLSKQQLQAWAMRMDKVYEAYVDLVGKDLPFDKIGIYLVSLNPNMAGQSGGADFRINKNILSSIANDLDGIGRHELGHVFGGFQVWYHDDESIANFFDYYASGRDPQGRYRAAADSYAKNPNQMTMFGDGSARDYTGKNSAYDMYLFGLVEKVGWGAYKKAFRSYHNEPRNGNVSARDLFNRVVGGNTAILRSLPDRGSMLDKFFPESKLRYVNPAQRSAPIKAKPTSVQQPAPRRKRGDRPRGMVIED